MILSNIFTGNWTVRVIKSAISEIKQQRRGNKKLCYVTKRGSAPFWKALLILCNKELSLWTQSDTNFDKFMTT